MRILLLEDDPDVAEFAARGLRDAGHEVELAEDGEEGLSRARAGGHDVLVVDRMLPRRDGLDVIRELRSAQNMVPVLILSALAEVSQRVEGLDAGSDDYLTKPFALSELLARVEALHRRAAADHGTEPLLQVADLVLDRLARGVQRGGEPVALQPREFRLLEFLMMHAGQVVTRTMLLEHVWDYHFDPQTNVIDVHISRLRQKIDGEPNAPLIHTVRGRGYRLAPEGDA
ncbi:MAG: response regulator transcription factor [Pseudomonadota bacterium]